MGRASLFRKSRFEGPGTLSPSSRGVTCVLLRLPGSMPVGSSARLPETGLLCRCPCGQHPGPAGHAPRAPRAGLRAGSSLCSFLCDAPASWSCSDCRSNTCLFLSRVLRNLGYKIPLPHPSVLGVWEEDFPMFCVVRTELLLPSLGAGGVPVSPCESPGSHRLAGPQALRPLPLWPSSISVHVAQW